jgi:hypothetical protein
MKKIFTFIPPEIPLPYVEILDHTDYKFLEKIQEKAKTEFGEKSKQYETRFLTFPKKVQTNSTNFLQIPLCKLQMYL